MDRKRKSVQEGEKSRGRRGSMQEQRGKELILSCLLEMRDREGRMRARRLDVIIIMNV
jgi:hypothetical protein